MSLLLDHKDMLQHQYMSLWLGNKENDTEHK